MFNIRLINLNALPKFKGKIILCQSIKFTFTALQAQSAVYKWTVKYIGKILSNTPYDLERYNSPSNFKSAVFRILTLGH